MNAGVVFVLLFVAATALRDVYFGWVFQGYRFFDVILPAFAISTVFFLVLVLVRMPGQFRLIRAAWKEAVLANIGSAAAWLSYFYALKLLEPSVVNTIHTGIGPITLAWLGVLGLHISSRARVRPIEHAAHFGILMSLAALSAVVLFGVSGIGGGVTAANILGLFLALFSGVVIALTTDVTKRMHERGVTPSGVLAVRFIGIVVIAAIVAASGTGEGQSLTDMGALAQVSAAGVCLIVVPLYLLQAGIARISAISTWVLLALGPSLVFAAQFMDGRIDYSPFTLACIALYTACAILASLVRRYETTRPAVAPSTAS